MLAERMRAITDGAETVERWDADRGGEIAVRAAASGAFSERQTHLCSEIFGSGEKRGAVFAFERGAIKAATNFELRAAKNRTQRV